MNLGVLKQVLQAEQAVVRHRATERDLKGRLRAGRQDKSESSALKTRLKRVRTYISGLQDQIFVWKCFGDSLAHVYLDKFAIKQAYFDTDRQGAKETAGMMFGKEGLPYEMGLMFDAIEHGVPAILCDITNVLRYGDVCLLGESDPVLLEVKSGGRLNQRGKRQAAKLAKLHSFLETDQAEGLRGRRGPVRRVTVDVPERSNVAALNECIAQAKADGDCITQPERGVIYAAFYGKPNLDSFTAAIGPDPALVYMLNIDKNDHAWAPYVPFTMSIRAEDSLLDFIEGRLFLFVVIKPEILCDMMQRDDWMVRYRPGVEYPIQFLHPATKAYFGVSGEFIARAAYEFISLSWMAEANAPSIEKLKGVTDDFIGPPDPEEHRRRIIANMGSDDEWAQLLLDAAPL
ncbi:MAG TPA: hypothetical protein VK403_05290 [Allosphingosinicella sp.]|nr:hypothetical protein [Allosphingosinicella sp.]